MNNFTKRERERERTPRSAAEIMADMKMAISSSKANHIGEYTTENSTIFSQSMAYQHVFITAIGGINGAVDIAEMEESKEGYENLIEAIDSTKNMSHSTTWSDFFEDGEKHDVLKVVRLFRDEIEKGFADGKINENTKNNGIEIADKLKETYTKLRDLGKELEMAIGKNTTAITR
ncbi:MAG: hypothetical protein R3D71_10860 [Rickettsiales bacterium]